MTVSLFAGITLTLLKSQVHWSGLNCKQWWACSSLMSAFCLQRQAANLRADCSTVGLYWLILTWQRIFKCLLQVTVVCVCRMQGRRNSG